MQHFARYFNSHPDFNRLNHPSSQTQFRMNTWSFYSRCVGVLALLLISTARFVQAQSDDASSENQEEYYFRAQLIWASNENLSSDDLKPLDDKTTEKLRKVFKWENYWEINRKYVGLEQDSRQITKISPECEITLKRIESDEESKVEVVLIGKKNPIIKKTQHIQQNECLVLAGPDKDGTAWFVILTRVDEIPEDEKEAAADEAEGAKICYCSVQFEHVTALKM